jgi:hypothetical protein
MRRRYATVIALLAAALVLTSVAGAKEFKPGDLRLCNSARCVTIRDQRTLDRLASLIYTGPPPAVARTPRMNTPYFELRFRSGYVPGIVATKRLDRFLSYGVYLERFQGGTWYRVPPRAARALRILAAGLRPLRLTPAAVKKSR